MILGKNLAVIWMNIVKEDDRDGFSDVTDIYFI